ncbi:MAG: HD domain-containing protein [Planctomycetota bacterium]|nr:MAG: HD domain-containing protein [Planctomycetota bacterium]
MALDDAKREKREILGQIEDIKSALSDTFGIQQDARKREEANRELRRQVQLLEARLESAKRDKEKLVAAQAELRQTSAEADKLEKQKAKLLRSVDGLKADVRDFKKQLENRTREADKLQRREVSLEDRFKSTEHARDMLIAEKQDVVDQLTSLRKDYEETRKEAIKVKRDLVNTESGLERTNQSRERLTEEVEQVKSDLRRVREHTSQLEGQKAALEQELHSLQQEKQVHEKIRLRKEALERECDSIKGELKKLEEERSAQEGSLRDLHGEIAHLKKEIDLGKESIREYEARVSDLTAQAEKLQVKLAEVEVEREVYQRQTAELEKQVSEEASARKEIESSTRDEIELLHQKVTTGELRAAEIEEERDTLSAQVISLERVLEDRSSQMKTMSSELEERTREASEVRRDANEMERLLHERMGEVESAVARKTVEAESLSNEKEQLLKELEQTRRKLNFVTSDFEDAKESFEKEEADWKNIRKELDVTHAVVKNLKVEVEMLYEERSGLQNSLAKEELELKETRAALDSEKVERVRAEAEVEAQVREYDEARKNIKSLKTELRDARSAIRDETDTSARKREDDKRIAALDEQVEALTESRENLSGELKEREIRIAELNAQLDSAVEKDESARIGVQAAEKAMALAKEYEASLEAARAEWQAEKTELEGRISELDGQLGQFQGDGTDREKGLLEDKARLEKEKAGLVAQLEEVLTEQSSRSRSEREKTAAKLANLEAIVSKFDDRPEDMVESIDFGRTLVAKLTNLPVDEVFFEHLALFFEPGQAFPELGTDTLSSMVSAIRETMESKPLEALGDRAFGRPALHAYRVSILAMMLAQTQGFPGNKVLEVGVAALLHDIGSGVIGPGDLYGRFRSPEDRRSYLQHPKRGVEEAGKLGDFSEDVLRGIGEHHELLNGSGFPTGLSGSAIHDFAKIIAIVDRFVNLVHPMPGVEPLLPAMAMKELILITESQEFDNVLLRGLLSSVGLYPLGSFAKLKTGEIARIVATNSDDPRYPMIEILQDARGTVLEDPTHVNLATTDLAIANPVWCEQR